MNEEPEAGGRVPSIWMRPERSARGPAPEHSRAEIASAAVALADAEGLAAVTMRAVAAAVGTAPASLYRYVTTRDELLELMADQVSSEFSYDGLVHAEPVADLLALAHQALNIYRTHPWLLAIPPTVGLPGPNALAYMEHALAVLAGVELSGPAKLEVIGLFSGAVRSFAQLEVDSQRAGRDAAQWPGLVAAYMVQVVAAGQHPHLAAAVADQPAAVEPAPQEPLFDRALTRILTGLLPAAGSHRPPVG
jgi:AcrR family transcriptional regulator